MRCCEHTFDLPGSLWEAALMSGKMTFGWIESFAFGMAPVSKHEFKRMRVKRENGALGGPESVGSAGCGRPWGRKETRQTQKEQGRGNWRVESDLNSQLLLCSRVTVTKFLDVSEHQRLYL